MEYILYYIAFCIAAIPAILFCNKMSENELFEILFVLLVLLTLPVNGLVWLSIYGGESGRAKRRTIKNDIEHKINSAARKATNDNR